MTTIKLLALSRVPIATRGISLSATKWKWEKDPKGIGITTGFRMGNPQDPILHTHDLHKPPGDDPEYSKIYYREAPKRPGYLDKVIHTLCATIFWYWFFYQFYWRSDMVFGEHYLPYPREFSDEELGIPPDDAPDPTPDQYWGNHGKDYKNYR